MNQEVPSVGINPRPKHVIPPKGHQSILEVLIFYYFITLLSGHRTYLRVYQRNADPVIVEQEATFGSVFIELLWT